MGCCEARRSTTLRVEEKLGERLCWSEAAADCMRRGESGGETAAMGRREGERGTIGERLLPWPKEGGGGAAWPAGSVVVAVAVAGERVPGDPSSPMSVR